MSAALGSVVGSIINNVESAIATAAVDVVGVYDQNYNQLFSGARPIKAKIAPKAKLMDHPLETGATITDHRVFDPTEIELSLIFTPATYLTDYQAVLSAYTGAALLTVQTRADTYLNMAIQAPPHEESPDQADTITMILSLRQVTFVQAQTSSVPTPAAATNSATVKKGAQQGTPATATQTSAVQSQTSESAGGSSTLYNLIGGL